MGVFRVCEAVKAIGYDGLEIAPFTLGSSVADLTLPRRRELRSMIADSGLQTIGLHWLLAKTEGYYLTSPDASIRIRTAEYLRDLARLTHDLGGSLMVFGSPKQRDLVPGVDYDQAFRYAAEVFSSLMPTLEEVDVGLCLEPLAPSETNFLNTCRQASDLVEVIDHPNFRLHMDVKAQSSEPIGSVPELIAQYAASMAISTPRM